MSVTKPLESKIDYTFIHNKACELYKVIKGFLDSSISKKDYSDALMERTERTLKEVAFNESKRRGE